MPLRIGCQARGQEPLWSFDTGARPKTFLNHLLSKLDVPHSTRFASGEANVSSA